MDWKLKLKGSDLRVTDAGLMSLGGMTSLKFKQPNSVCVCFFKLQVSAFVFLNFENVTNQRQSI